MLISIFIGDLIYSVLTVKRQKNGIFGILFHANT